MAYKELVLALSMFVAAAPVSATSLEPKTAPDGTPETKYCLRVEPVIGSHIQTIQCWTREEWAAKEVNVDEEWARDGIRVIG